ncbi:MAG: hypothetical protein HC825_06385 [Oscillatoriales cyanobacterium RM1_1_9]|nr:hypothetical protein [Oscillatoriales cyanobacterium RM1_1_9]
MEVLMFADLTLEQTNLGVELKVGLEVLAILVDGDATLIDGGDFIDF